MKRFFFIASVLSALALPMWGQNYPSVHMDEQSTPFLANNSTAWSVSPYVNGFFLVRDDNTGISTIVDSTLNRCGKVCLSRSDFSFWPQFTKEGVATAVLKDDVICIIDTSGKIVKEFPLGTRISRRFVDGIAMVEVRRDKRIASPCDIHYIDTKGNFIYPHLTMKDVDYGSLDISKPYPLRDGRRAYYDPTKNRFGYLDASGKIVIPAVYTAVHDFSEGLAATTTVDANVKLWGYIGVDGETVIEPFVRHEPGDFHDGHAVVIKQNGKQLYMNKFGRLVSAEVDVAYRYFNGYAIITNGPKNSYVVNKEKKLVRRLESRLISSLGYNESNQTIIYDQYILSPDGKVLLAFDLSERLIHPFIDDYALYYSARTGRFGFIDKNGRFKVYFVESEF